MALTKRTLKQRAIHKQIIKRYRELGNYLGVIKQIAFEFNMSPSTISIILRNVRRGATAASLYHQEFTAEAWAEYVFSKRSEPKVLLDRGFCLQLSPDDASRYDEIRHEITTRSLRGSYNFGESQLYRDSLPTHESGTATSNMTWVDFDNIGLRRYK